MKINFKKIFLFWFFLFISLLVFCFSVNIYIEKKSENYIYSKINDLENKKVWLVLWAQVFKWWIPSNILKDRLDSSIRVYNSWKFEIFLLSWDHWTVYYDEVNTMKDYLLKKWIPKEKLFLDHAGFDTYDSLYRAKNIFWAEDLIIFTQQFHLPRAVYIWKWLWLDVTWYVSDKHIYLNESYNKRREFFARIKAFLEVEILHTKSKYLWGKIDLDWSYLESWD